ncbi:BTAD domain-containing putative transcriptional regulator [Candidatus Leptofilum sp.]|uniref:BTAD domain-containing putative transcriptional regulator n=1 Tax=Candidatus Leptofilum sp. TaxID=3241576 RepID=UPI003B5CD053
MPQLTINLLGEFSVTLDGQPVTNFYSDKVRALLAYLVVEQGQAHSRSKLAGLLWPESPEKQARQSLRQALLHLRKALKDTKADPPLILADRQTVHLSSAVPLQTDLAAFEDALNKSGGAAEAVAAYRGDFLDGFFLADSAEFDDWVLMQREMLRGDLLAALNLLVAQHEHRGEYPQAIKAAQRWLTFEPWQEEAHRSLMRCYFAQGDQAAALNQFAACETTLNDELGIEPTSETRSLYNEIRLSSETGRSNLPVPTTPFVGRVNELDGILTRLADPGCRLLTIVGAGGSGKTRLAIEAAGQVDLPHKVLFVGLDGLDEVTAVPLALADLLGISLSGSQTPQARLADYLAERPFLLLLDNVEQLLTGANAAAMRQLLADLLQACPELKLLATSRIRLQLQAEWVYPLAGLALPTDASALTNSDAVQLFCQSGQRVQPGFSLNSENETAVAHICQLCAGLPLALELAASWLHVLNPTEIESELGDSLDLLTTSNPDIPARQQSLHAVFNQSWQRLTPPEQQALRRLAVFRGGFSREAAQAVAEIRFPTLAALTEKSLIQRIVTTGLARFSLHKPLRLFASEKLQAAGEEAEVHSRHSRYFLRLLAQQQQALEQDGQRQALAEIGREIDNVRAAWQHTIAQKASADLDAALESLYYFYDTQSWLREGAEQFAAAAELVEGARYEKENGRIWARLIARQAWFAFHLGERDSARQKMESALAILHAQGHQREMLYPFCFLAAACHDLGELRTAQRAAEQALEIAATQQDDFYAGIANNILGQVAQKGGDWAQAKQHHQQSLLLSNQTGNLLTRAFALSFLGEIALRQEQPDEAASLFGRSLAVRRDLDDQRGIAFSQLMLGDVALAGGDVDTAVTHYQSSLQTYRTIGDLWGVAEALLRLTPESLATPEAARPLLAQILQATQRTRTASQAVATLNRAANWYGWDDLGSLPDDVNVRYEKVETAVQKALARLLT